jgi:hypothetical protein
VLWTVGKTFEDDPFELEKDLEDAILQVSASLFGRNRIYLDAKRRIGSRGRTRNIPDGYLLDLASVRQPKLYVVENELAKHEPLRHIAVQILEFSLSFEATPHLVKDIVKEALRLQPEALSQCDEYATKHGFENVDYLLERMIFGSDKFNALVVIDELDADLETVLISRFKFPVEILVLERFRGSDGQRVFRFEPFLSDLVASESTEILTGEESVRIDPAELDTIVVPARDEGFKEVFIGENRWYKIRMHTSVIPRIKYIAAYRVAPESAITHIAPVASIDQWPDSNKYVINFAEPAKPIGPIRLVNGGRVKPPQAPRYTSMAMLQTAENLDGAF